jgi:cobalt-zinc-cadmium resistance protein CzcA
VIAFMKRHYLRMLHWALANSRRPCCRRWGCWSPRWDRAAAWHIVHSGDEGRLDGAGINRVPNISLEESIKMENRP